MRRLIRLVDRREVGANNVLDSFITVLPHPISIFKPIYLVYPLPLTCHSMKELGISVTVFNFFPKGGNLVGIFMESVLILQALQLILFLFEFLCYMPKDISIPLLQLQLALFDSILN